MEVIGVFHKDEHVRFLLEYVQANFGTNESISSIHEKSRTKISETKKPSIMIEAEPDDDLGPKSYFGTVETSLAPEWDVIRGDKYRSISCPIQRRIESKMGEIFARGKNNYEGLSLGVMVKDLFKLMFLNLEYMEFYPYEAYLPHARRKRNEGMIETLDDFLPDVSVVGMSHAYAIKKARPETNFTAFLVQNPQTITQLAVMKIFSLANKGLVPDNLVYCPKDPELYNPVCDGVDIKYLI